MYLRRERKQRQAAVANNANIKAEESPGTTSRPAKPGTVSPIKHHHRVNPTHPTNIIRYIVSRYGTSGAVKLPPTSGGLAFAKALAKRHITTQVRGA